MSGLAWHTLFETLSYLVGGQLYWWQRRRLGDAIGGPHRLAVAGFSILGAAFGSRLLAAFENPALFNFSGKTVVGGLLGGLIAVELGKLALRVKQSTGDLFAIPLCIGMSVGRIGCFLAGMEDDTHGSPTSLRWGHNYGDGLLRHPVQIYEIAFLLTLAAVLTATRRRLSRSGDQFRIFLSSYLAFRLLVDFLKPGYPRAGLTAIQWACVAGLIYYSRDIYRWLSAPSPPARPKESEAHV